MTYTLKIPINVRRFDLKDNPEIQEEILILRPNMTYNELKQQIHTHFNITDCDSKVIKVRNKDYALICMTQLLEQNDTHKPYTIDINRVVTCNDNKSSLLQDAYLDAVRQKLQGMQSRVSQAEEVLLPQLQWRRQSHLDHTVSKLSARVAFLNRRIDELTPPEWKNKIPESIS